LSDLVYKVGFIANNKLSFPNCSGKDNLLCGVKIFIEVIHDERPRVEVDFNANKNLFFL